MRPQFSTDTKFTISIYAALTSRVSLVIFTGTGCKIIIDKLLPDI